MDLDLTTAAALLGLLEPEALSLADGRTVLARIVAMGTAAAPLVGTALLAPATPRFRRLACAWVLGEIGGAYAERALAQAIRGTDPDVAEVARAAHERLRLRARRDAA